MNTPDSYTVKYGDSAPDQMVEITEPSRRVDEAVGVAVLIHGGYWRAHLDRTLMEPLVPLLLAHGWAVANAEYRRGRTGRWPVPLQDTVSALTAVRDHTHQRPLVTIGHSVGGQLALLTADAADAVVALAPVTDVERTRKEGLGEDAATEYFGDEHRTDARVLDQASPLRHSPTSTPLLLVHGVPDDRVPVQHSLDFIQRQWAFGADLTATFLPSTDHLSVIGPDTAHWASTLAWMEAAVERPRGRS